MNEEIMQFDFLINRFLTPAGVSSSCLVLFKGSPFGPSLGCLIILCNAWNASLMPVEKRPQRAGKKEPMAKAED